MVAIMMHVSIPAKVGSCRQKRMSFASGWTSTRHQRASGLQYWLPILAFCKAFLNAKSQFWERPKLACAKVRVWNAL